MSRGYTGQAACAREGLIILACLARNLIAIDVPGKANSFAGVSASALWCVRSALRPYNNITDQEPRRHRGLCEASKLVWV